MKTKYFPLYLGLLGISLPLNAELSCPRDIGTQDIHPNPFHDGGYRILLDEKIDNIIYTWETTHSFDFHEKPRGIIPDDTHANNNLECKYTLTPEHQEITLKLSHVKDLGFRITPEQAQNLIDEFRNNGTAKLEAGGVTWALTSLDGNRGIYKVLATKLNADSIYPAQGGAGITLSLFAYDSVNKDREGECWVTLKGIVSFD